jgi:hypothetical protein
MHLLLKHEENKTSLKVKSEKLSLKGTIKNTKREKRLNLKLYKLIQDVIEKNAIETLSSCPNFIIQATITLHSSQYMKH